MKVRNVGGHRVYHTAILFGKMYMFAYDGEGVTYMIKVNADGTLDIL